MKKIMLGFFAMVLALPMMAVAQSGQMSDQGQMQSNQQPMQSDQGADKRMQQQANQAASLDQTGQSNLPKHNMTGMVSNGGKSFTSDNTTYIVNNPKSLKKYDNQNVSVKYQFDTDKNAIHIINVMPAQ